MTTKSTFAHEVDYDLNDEEVLEYYDKAQGRDEHADEVEVEIRDDVKDRKAEVKKLRQEAKKLREAAKERKERRSVTVYTELRGSQVVYIRVDTAEVVDQRGATPEDLQQTFPGLATGGNGDDDLPLEPDYTPGDDSPRAPNEKKPRKGRKARGK